MSKMWNKLKDWVDNTAKKSDTFMILTNATISKHMSILFTNNFANNHLGQKYRKHYIYRNFRRLKWCSFEKYPTNTAKPRKCLLANFSVFFWEFRDFKKLITEFHFVTRCICCFFDYLSLENVSKTILKSILNLLNLKFNVIE